MNAFVNGDYAEKSFQARRWAFTVEKCDVTTPIVNNNHTVWLGPVETGQKKVGHRHGLFSTTSANPQIRSAKLRKTAVLRLLNGLGIFPNYLAPVSDLRSYISYMYKESEIPHELQLLQRGATSKNSSYNKKLALEVIASFDTKPSFNVFKLAVLDKDFNLPEIMIKRAYTTAEWPDQRKIFAKAFRKKKATIKPWSPSDACLVINHIISQATKIEWNLLEHTPFDLKILLVQAALEARNEEVDGIELSPHFMLHGAAGKGKTLLGQLLFPTAYASMMTNDSQGVGQMAMRLRHKVLKIDDAGNSFFQNDSLTAAVKFMYHNTWAAKIHGDRQENNATCAFITTNIPYAVHRLAGANDPAPIKRRFIEAYWPEDALPPATGCQKQITTDLTDRIVLQLLEELITDLNLNKLYSTGVHPHVEYLQEVYKCLNEDSDLDEEDVDEPQKKKSKADASPGTSLESSPGLQNHGDGLDISYENGGCGGPQEFEIPHNSDSDYVMVEDQECPQGSALLHDEMAAADMAAILADKDLLATICGQCEIPECTQDL